MLPRRVAKEFAGCPFYRSTGARASCPRVAAGKLEARQSVKASENETAARASLLWFADALHETRGQDVRAPALMGLSPIDAPISIPLFSFRCVRASGGRIPLASETLAARSGGQS